MFAQRIKQLLCLLSVVCITLCYGNTDEAIYKYLKSLEIEELIKVVIILDVAHHVHADVARNYKYLKTLEIEDLIKVEIIPDKRG